MKRLYLLPLLAMVMVFLRLTDTQAQCADPCAPLPAYTAADINGPTQVAVGSVSTYTLPMGPNLQSLWQLSGGGVFAPPTLPGTLVNAVSINWPSTGTFTFTVIPRNSCGQSGPPIQKTVTVVSQFVPAPPPITVVSGNDGICGSTTYMIPPMSGMNVVWNYGFFMPESMLNSPSVLVSGNQLTVTWDASCTYIPASLFINAAYNNGSTTGRFVQRQIGLGSGSPSFAISGSNPEAVCLSTSSGYSITNLPSGSSVSWTLSGGGSLSTSGNNANVTWNTVGTYTLSANVSSACGVGSASKTIRVGTPSAPTINGNFASCASSVQTYTATIPGTSISSDVINWSLSGGGTLSSSTGSSTNVTWGSTTGTYQLRAYASNSCGNSTTTVQSITIGGAMSNPGFISPSPGPYCQNSNATFTIAPITGATQYIWTVTAPDGTVSTPSTAIPSLIVPLSKVGGYITKVRGYNGTCYTAESGPISISVTPVPTFSLSIPPPSVCAGATYVPVPYTSTGVTSFFRIDWITAGANDVPPMPLPLNVIPISGYPSIPGTYNGFIYVSQDLFGPCESAGTPVQVTVIASPGLFTVGGGGSSCTGGVPVTLNGSETGVNYQLLVNGVTSGTVVAGTGSALTWSNQITAGTYTVTATFASGGCSRIMTGSATISNTLPNLFTVTGGGAICSGNPGLPVFLNGSQTGINYQLKLNGVNTGSPVAGTGATIIWSNQTTAGNYNVLATNATTGCSIMMNGVATIVVNPTPVLYNVGGGGSFCTGGSGVPVTLSGSQTGVNYQLRINGVNSGSAAAGTGSPLTWANQTTTGTYTVQATPTSGACSVSMTGSVAVSSSIPNLYNVTGSGSICAGSTGVSITLSGSQSGVNYQLKINGANTGTPVAGNGSVLTWFNQTTPGTYTILATDATTGCSRTMNGSPQIIVNPLPTTYSVGGGGTICSGSTGVSVTLNGSQSGVNYQLKINGVNSGSVKAGTGSALTWTNQNTAGTYSVTATNATTTCTQNMTGSATVIVNPLPIQFPITGGGSYCSGGPGVNIVLGGSEVGVNYQLKINGTNSGAPISGTGSPISWLNLTTAGTYTIVATNITTGCSQTMLGSAVITINPLPNAYNVSGGGSYCSGGSGVSINLSGSQSGVNYQLKVNGIDVGSPMTGTGSTLSWANQTMVGSYTVTANNATTGCIKAMNSSATVTDITPNQYTVGGGGSYCADGSGVGVTLSGSQSGISYQLMKDGLHSGSAIMGTGSALTWSNQTVGTYTIEATKRTEMISNYEATSTTGFNANQSVSISPVTTNGQTYVKVVSNQSSSTPGVWPIEGNKSVTPGSTYTFRVKGYRVNTPNVYLYVKNASTNTNLIWPGALLPQGSANEGWVETTFTVPTGCTAVSLGILFSGPPAIGDTFYVNALSFSLNSSVCSIPMTGNVQVGIISASIITSGPLCAGGSTTLTAGVTYIGPVIYTYKWQEYKNIILNIWDWVDISSASSITVSKAAKYRVKVTAAGCTSISPELTLTALSNPKPTISYTGDVCTNGYLTLTSSVGSSYRWSNGLTSRTINGYPGGSYYVTVTNSNGCSNTSSTFGVSECQPTDPCDQINIANGRVPEFPCPIEALGSESPISEAVAYPNPAKGKVTIRIPQMAETDTPVIIVNQFGQIVKSEVLSKGTDRTEFNVTEMTNGIYLVQIKNITLKLFIDN